MNITFDLGIFDNISFEFGLKYERTNAICVFCVFRFGLTIFNEGACLADVNIS